ncbi:tRNA-uridine aminocarboxypropyltransferase 2 isoform X2 [Aquila chrysaetos chrysaetos]|uniref:tRNA-uridine aminocarboxypropyltransferase 2 isoform X2 n=2 Tax=Aquila chrysaetos chrysaetos TaxID=223781 RepID=UPI001B7D438F|nr:tRNA-uridine aminocarboxypropyltransferase 2 isoform X2 [Aquila chrysaetos chrysaetos]XP_040976814.1 tRNA-uridine aminocarboxypropyltransferase 2 isoform X2 [Aquila chrysaetos chrysaetos]
MSLSHLEPPSEGVFMSIPANTSAKGLHLLVYNSASSREAMLTDRPVQVSGTVKGRGITYCRTADRSQESRVLRTVPLLAACLPPDKYKILVGRRFSEDRYPELATVCRNPNTLILYPGAEATNLEEVAVMYSRPSVMIIIDGTWSQAKDIFYKNSLFRLPKQVQLKPNISSQYVIRTQPTNTCLSTLECAAVALSIMEKNKSIQETILRPLQALCSFQLQHGAQIHHSKEHLLKNGLYDKPMPKNKRKLRRMELLVNNVKI